MFAQAANKKKLIVADERQDYTFEEREFYKLVCEAGLDNDAVDATMR